MKFNKKLFIKGIVELKDSVLWAKDIVSILNLRKLIIYGIIIGLFAGYFYWRGFKNTNAIVDIGYKEELTMKAPKNYKYMDNLAVHKDKDSNNWNWIDFVSKEEYAKVLLKDVPQSAKLRPYGFMNKVVGIMGLGLGYEDSGGEWGAGFRYVRLWDIRSEVIATNKGVYLGVSYKPKNLIFENTSIGISGGKGYKSDNRILGYFCWVF